MRRRVVWSKDDQVGEFLRSARLEARMTQAEIAKRLGCSISHVSKIESGKQLVSIGEFIAWAESIDRGAGSLTDALAAG